MHSISRWHTEEQRVAEHLSFVGYRPDPADDSQGWRFAMSPMAPPVGFRVGSHMLCLYADYPAGLHEPAAHYDLLRLVNRFNATQWLVRSALVTRNDGFHARLSIRLQANLPLNLPADELGACLFTWIRESTHIEQAAKLRAWASQDRIDQEALPQESRSDGTSPTN